MLPAPTCRHTCGPRSTPQRALSASCTSARLIFMQVFSEQSYADSPTDCGTRVCRAKPHRHCSAPAVLQAGAAVPPAAMPRGEAPAWRAVVHSSRCGLHQARRRQGRGALRDPAVVWCAIKENTDYVATASDSRVLQRPLREELRPREIVNVFDHPRNLRERRAPRCSRSLTWCLAAHPVLVHNPA